MPKEILIVDDEPSIVVPIQFLMEQQGYTVMVAENGESALDIIYKYKPDLILLDIMLPRIDGYEVCEIVRLNPEYRGIKIIFLTAKGRRGNRQRSGTWCGCLYNKAFLEYRARCHGQRDFRKNL